LFCIFKATFILLLFVPLPVFLVGQVQMSIGQKMYCASYCNLSIISAVIVQRHSVQKIQKD